MIIVGCDFHPTWQQIGWVDTETGETAERKLEHSSGEARVFSAELSVPALIGVEATGNRQWFLDLMIELGHQVWVGDAAQIRASYVRKQKTDKRDAGHVLKLLLEDRFSPYLGSESGGARSTPAAAASPQAGGDAHASEE